MKILTLLKTACLVFTLSISPITFAESLVDRYGIGKPLGNDAQTRIFSKLFDIELWSATFPKKYDQELTIRITFASRFDNADVIEFLSEEAQEIHDFSNAQLKSLRESMKKSLTCNPKASSILDFHFIPQKGIEVLCDGESGQAFIPTGPHSFFLLDVFLHPNSEYKNLSINS